MTSLDGERIGVDAEAFRSLCDEASDLVRRLEGTSVQRVTLEAGGARLEIERAAAAPPTVAVAAAAGPAAAPAQVAPHRDASGFFEAIAAGQDNRIAVLAPLVGTFYRAPQPGAKPFVEEGQTVGSGDTVAIVEAMKLMNEVPAGEAGRVVEIVVENGERVEFEQVLMYLEPADE